jgi:hypothetical protein
MERNEFDFVENIRNIPDRSVITTIKGLMRRINYLISLDDKVNEQKIIKIIEGLETRLGVFEEEAIMRGLNINE